MYTFHRAVATMSLSFILFACNSEPAPAEANGGTDTTAQPDTNVVNEADAPQTKPDPLSGQCFAKMTANDTVILKFTARDTLVEGVLSYRYSEKDKNEGTINGVMRGDTLIADYNFISEGINSVRQVIFLKRNNRMIEGFGNVVDDRGKMVFENTAALTFDESLTLTATDCSRVAGLQK